MALKKGVCKNFSNCTLADKDEIQEVDSSEFICKECGKPLDEIIENPGSPRILTYIIIAIILIGGGVGAYLGFFRSADDPLQPLPDPDLSNPNPHAVALSLNKTILNLDAGSCDSLVATYSTTPSDVDSTVSLSFSSNDTNVVQIDHNGLVKAISKGEATIYVIAQMEVGVADTAMVNVNVSEKNEIATTQPEPMGTKKSIISDDNSADRRHANNSTKTDIKQPHERKKPTRNIVTPNEHSANDYANNSSNEIEKHYREWYMWKGNYVDGKEHGKGILIVKQSYIIDLCNHGSDEILVYPGDTIIAQFDHGKLCGGRIDYRDGSRIIFDTNSVKWVSHSSGSFGFRNGKFYSK